MAVDSGMDLLSERAVLMRESLQKSQTITDNVVSILGSFDSRLSALESAMRPTQIRTHAIRKAHENIDKTLKSAEVILSQFDLLRQAETKVLKGPHEDLESYLEAIAQLRKVIRYFSSNKGFKNSDGVLNHANSLLAKAQSKLEEEFKQLLVSYSKAVEPDRLFDGLPNSLRPSADGEGNGKSHGGHHNDDSETAAYTLPVLIPSRVLPLLHDLAQQMVQAGHQQMLLQIYRETRTFVLEESLRKLGVEKLSKEDVQRMQWEVLEAKIGNWIHFMRIAVKLLFAGERQVCDQIFRGFDSLSDQCFAEVTVSSVSMLLSFGDAIARSKRSPEKLFVLLDMYEIMRELHTEIETIFKGKACLEIRNSATGLTKRLAQTAQETFGDFEEAVEKDATKTAVLDGTVHPLTSYVINYVKFLFDYQATLKQLFSEFGNGDDSNSQLASVTMRIMQALQNNLEGKSKQYKDQALTHLFLMNNIHYMVRSVRRSEAKDLLGDDWVQRHRRVVQQHANLYKRTAWTKILQTSSAQGLTSSGGGSVEGGNSSGVSRGLLKERFKMFNMQFDELHQRQSQWTVPDTELRESLRLAVAEVLLPAYRSFLKRFGPLVESGKNSQRYIKYTAEDLERLLDCMKVDEDKLGLSFVISRMGNFDPLASFGSPRNQQIIGTAQETFGDFEEAVEKDATKTAVLDGTVHPLTSYVINYVKFLFDYQATLKQLFSEFGNGDDSNSQLASVTMRIMQAFQNNLEGKSKQYKDQALTHLFLMNNIHYMVRSVRRSEAKDLLGDDWVQRHRRVVQQHANLYKRTAWTKVRPIYITQTSSAQGLTSSGGGSVEGGNSSGVSRGLLKEGFKMCNMQFDELHQRQSQWTVPDTELRESLRLVVAEVLLPAYRSFLKRFGPLVESGKNSQRYIKYTAEDLERLLGELFEGKSMNEPRR
uniref:Exocyst subunit Exo70 family protein n=1 Tax=Brassica oleracea var. oleracea TaxID=109376 RepID=A0A0D3EI50_BRAOL